MLRAQELIQRDTLDRFGKNGVSRLCDEHGKIEVILVIHTVMFIVIGIRCNVFREKVGYVHIELSLHFLNFNRHGNASA